MINGTQLSLLSISALFVTLSLCLTTGCDDSTDPDQDPLRSLADSGVQDATAEAQTTDLGGGDITDLSPPLPSPPALRPRFNLSGESFYDTPWPSDARLSERGTPELSDFPTTHPPFLKVIRELEERVFGFANMPIAYVALEGDTEGLELPSPVASLDSSSPIQLLALGDQCGLRIPIEVKLREVGDAYIPAQTLQIKSAVGYPLEPGRPYGLIVSQQLSNSSGLTMSSPDEFRAVWSGEDLDPSGWSRSLEPLRDCVMSAAMSAEVTPDDIAIATVFTPQDPLRELRALRDIVMDAERVETRPPERFERDGAWSRKRLRLTTYSGLIPVPVFQRGEPPYRSEGGGLVFEGGEPQIQRWEPTPFAVAMRDFPEDAPFEGDRPVLVFTDGTGWDRWTHLYSRWLSEILDAGFVVVSVMPQFHGGRAGFEGDPELPTFNFLNPESGRVNFQQQAVELSYLLRVIREQLADRPELPPLDVSRIVYGGHSQGAVTGAMNAAVESGYAGYVFNGLSSYLTLTILERDDILDFELAVRTLLGNEGPLDLFSPALQLMQLGSESVDPQNFARLWRGTPENPEGNHVFVINGFRDETTTPRGMDHLTLSANLPVLDPPGWDIDPLELGEPERVQLPLSGNERAYSGAPLTLATYLDPTSGHGTVYRNATLRQLSIDFWRTALSEEVPSLTPDAELMCDDGADGDQDGVADCDDSDCVNQEPCVERRCADELDGDRDGLIDCDDPDCAESCQESECDDELDNDDDGLIDCDDPSCAALEPCVERLCGDGEDGDGDELIDCDDPDCSSEARCRETRCGDEEDNNDNGLIDCEDPECADSLACPELSCEDGLDNDISGLADCDDPRCYHAERCQPPIEETCDDGLDDDGDELIDCADPDCALSCDSGICADVDLGSRLGIAVFQGTLEGAPDSWAPGDCTQLGSGEDAPDISLRWTAPADGVYEISTLGSEADTVLSVFPGDCDRERELGCHDDQPGVSSSAILLEISEGTSVTFVISAFNADDAGPIALHITPAL